MPTLILALVVPVLIVAGLIVVVIRRGLQMKQLCADGVEATGVVTKKIQYATAKGAARNDRWMAYEYRDAQGATHAHKSLVTAEFWNAHTEGGPIAIVYSQSRPAISAPRHLVEDARRALNKGR